MSKERNDKLTIYSLARYIQNEFKQLGTQYTMDTGNHSAIKGFYYQGLSDYQIYILNEFSKANILTFNTKGKKTEFVIKIENKTDLPKIKDNFDKVVTKLGAEMDEINNFKQNIPYSCNVNGNIIDYSLTSSKSSSIPPVRNLFQNPVKLEILVKLKIIKYNDKDQNKKQIIVLKPEELNKQYEQIITKQELLQSFYQDLSKTLPFLNLNPEIQLCYQIKNGKIFMGFILDKSVQEKSKNSYEEQQIYNKLLAIGILQKNDHWFKTSKLFLIDNDEELTLEQLKKLKGKLRTPLLDKLMELPYLKDRLGRIRNLIAEMKHETLEEAKLQQTPTDQNLYNVLSENQQNIQNSLSLEPTSEDSKTVRSQLNMMLDQYTKGELTLSHRTSSLLKDTVGIIPEAINKENKSINNYSFLGIISYPATILYNYGYYCMEYLGLSKQTTTIKTSSMINIKDSLVNIYQLAAPERTKKEESFKPTNKFLETGQPSSNPTLWIDRVSNSSFSQSTEVSNRSF